MQQTANLLTIPFNRIDGNPATLSEYGGRVLLIVNVASKCGLTPQYASLEALYKAHQADGLEILGFPANNFGDQEPGTNAEISEFCALTYGVSFPMFEKISVKAPDQHPLYAGLTSAIPSATVRPDSDFPARLAKHGFTRSNEADVLWNFEKFLLNRQGEVVARFAPDITAEDPLLVQAVGEQLALR